MSELDIQIGGDHYKSMPIQPVEFCHKNGIGFLPGNVIKYVCRYKSKNGRQDLQKALHYLKLLIELEFGPEPKEPLREDINLAIDRVAELRPGKITRNFVRMTDPIDTPHLRLHAWHCCKDRDHDGECGPPSPTQGAGQAAQGYAGSGPLRAESGHTRAAYPAVESPQPSQSSPIPRGDVGYQI